MEKKIEIEQDKRLLNSLGSYSSIARKLGKSPQCVFNWSKRGIPAAIKLKHPDLFLKKRKKNATGTTKKESPTRQRGAGVEARSLQQKEMK